MPKLRELWQCPKCGQRFETKNMWHSCGKFQLEALFAHSESSVFKVYKRFEMLVKSIGPVTIIPQKTRVAFQVRMRFVSAYPRRSHLLVGFDFSRRIGNPRFHKIEQYGRRSFARYIRVAREEDFDEGIPRLDPRIIRGWAAAACAVNT